MLPYYFIDMFWQRFALMNNLTEHVNSVHATQKKWICDLCGQRLNSKKSMETHKLVHQVNINDNIDENVSSEIEFCKSF